MRCSLCALRIDFGMISLLAPLFLTRIRAVCLSLLIGAVLVVGALPHGALSCDGLGTAMAMGATDHVAIAGVPDSLPICGTSDHGRREHKGGAGCAVACFGPLALWTSDATMKLHAPRQSAVLPRVELVLAGHTSDPFDRPPKPL